MDPLVKRIDWSLKKCFPIMTLKSPEEGYDKVFNYRVPLDALYASSMQIRMHTQDAVKQILEMEKESLTVLKPGKIVLDQRRVVNNVTFLVFELYCTIGERSVLSESEQILDILKVNE